MHTPSQTTKPLGHVPGGGSGVVEIGIVKAPESLEPIAAAVVPDELGLLVPPLAPGPPDARVVPLALDVEGVMPPLRLPLAPTGGLVPVVALAETADEPVGD